MNDLDRLEARLLILAAGRNCPGKEALLCLGINDTSSLQLCNPFCYLDSGGLQLLLYDCVDLVLHGVVKWGRPGMKKRAAGMMSNVSTMRSCSLYVTNLPPVSMTLRCFWDMVSFSESCSCESPAFFL